MVVIEIPDADTVFWGMEWLKCCSRTYTTFLQFAFRRNKLNLF